jgi:glycine C-acetyltransferase
MKKIGFDTGESETPITPIMVGEANKAAEFSSKLLEEKIFAQSIGFPTVPKNTARIRVMISAAHSKEDLDFALDKFENAGKDMGLI